MYFLFHQQRQIKTMQENSSLTVTNEVVHLFAHYLIEAPAILQITDALLWYIATHAISQYCQYHY